MFTETPLHKLWSCKHPLLQMLYVATNHRCKDIDPHKSFSNETQSYLCLTASTEDDYARTTLFEEMQKAITPRFILWSPLQQQKKKYLEYKHIPGGCFIVNGCCRKSADSLFQVHPWTYSRLSGMAGVKHPPP